MTHICIGKLTVIGPDNGLSPCRHSPIIWTNAGILVIQTLGTNFSEILSEIHPFSFKKMHLKISFAKCRQFCVSLNVLRVYTISQSLDDTWESGCCHKFQHVSIIKKMKNTATCCISRFGLDHDVIKSMNSKISNNCYPFYYFYCFLY